MGARAGAMIVTVPPVAQSRCPSTSRFSHLSTGPSPNRSSRSRWRSFVINSRLSTRTGAIAWRAASTPDTVRSVDDIPAVSNVAFKYARPCRARVRRDCRMRPFFSPAGPRRGGSGAGDISLRGPRFIARRRSRICARCCSPTGAGCAILAMHPTADAMPESSLSAMISWCIEEFGDGQRFGGRVARACRCRGGDRVS